MYTYLIEFLKESCFYKNTLTETSLPKNFSKNKVIFSLYYLSNSFNI